MRTFAPFLKLETRRFLKKRTLFLWLGLFIVLLFMLNNGIKRYIQTPNLIEKFKESETNTYQRASSYYDYSYRGLSILFITNQEMIFFDGTGFPNDLVGKLDSINNLGIFDSFKDDSLFSHGTSGLGGLPGILLLFGSLLALFFGYETLRPREYLKSLASLLSPGRVYAYIILSRLILLALSLLALFIGLFLFAWIRGIDILALDLASLAGFILVAYLVITFFFMLGVWVGLKIRQHFGIIALIVTWFILTMVLPGFIHTTFKINSVKSTSDYIIDNNKADIWKTFEKFFNKKISGANPADMNLRRELIEIYWNQHSKEMEKLEEGLKKKIEASIAAYEGAAVFVPTVFYQVTGNEAASKGLHSFIDFYAYLQELKREFLRFYIDHVYYKDPRIMENFIKSDENIFKSKSRLPKNFGLGLVITLAYILILIGFTFPVFRKFLFQPGVNKPLKAENPALYFGKDRRFIPLVLFRGHHAYNDHLYNLLAGRVYPFNKELTVEIDDIDLRQQPEKRDFIYLPHLDQVPGDIPADAYVLFMLRLLGVRKERQLEIIAALPDEIRKNALENLDDKLKGEVFLSILPYAGQKIILLDDVYLRMPMQFIFQLHDTVLKKTETDSSVIMLTSDVSNNFVRLKQAETTDVEIFNVWFSLIEESRSYWNKKT